MLLTLDMKKEYQTMWDTCAILERAQSAANHTCDLIIKHTDAYRKIVSGTALPWYFVACLHHLEVDGSFTKHLHNGDDLMERTTHVPAGHPALGEPPFTFEASAQDALQMHNLLRTTPFTIVDLLYEAEAYNGFGYRKHGINSPYVWSGTQFYAKGKYSSDGVYDAEEVSQEVGIAALLLRLAQRQIWQSNLTVLPLNGAQSKPHVTYGGTPNTHVRELQAYLNASYATQLKEDGIAGEITSNAFHSVFGMFLVGDPRTL